MEKEGRKDGKKRKGKLQHTWGKEGKELLEEKGNKRACPL